MTDAGSPSFSNLVTEGVNPALAAHLTILHNQLDGIAERQQKLIAELPEMIHDEAAGAMRQVLTDLRNDSDFDQPLWARGVGHVAEHLGTDKGKKVIQSQGFTNLAEWWVGVQLKVLRTSAANWVFAIVLGAIGLYVVILLANSGALKKVVGA